MNGLRQVFGDEALSRIKSCEFHFKESINKMARKLGQEAGETFKELCLNLLTCNLKGTYLEVKKSLEEFINEKSERQFLSSWLSWWDNRRTFIFGAFAPTNAPRMKLGAGHIVSHNIYVVALRLNRQVFDYKPNKHNHKSFETDLK